MTFLYRKEQNGIFYPNEKVLAFDKGDVIFYGPGYAANEIWENASEKYDFVSEEPKVFVRGRVEFFHLLFDTFSIILQEYNKNKDTLFIINFEHTKTVTEPAWHFFMQLLTNKGVKFQTVQITMKNPLRINNFKYFKEYPLLVSSVHNISNELLPFLSKEPATKKVFLSRKKFRTNRSDIAFFANEDLSNFTFKNDIRLDSEDVVAHYFESMGFEIICPEDFVNMEDQIKFFSTVKTLASVTSAGIANCIFMPKNSKVIELTVPLIVGGTESVHDVYHGISFAKFHKYISIPSMRKSKDIIDIIDSDDELKRFISE